MLLFSSPIAALPDPLITHPVGVLAVLLAVLAVVFRLSEWGPTARIFKVVPALVFCYFVPALLASTEVIPDSSPLYGWVKTYLLPVALLLLVLAVDIRGLVRLGPQAVIMLLAGTVGVVIGGPVSLLLVGRWLPADAWQGMAALSGSWIGGAANFVAIGRAAGATDAILGPIIIVDVLAAYTWMGVLFYLAGHQRALDRLTGARVDALRDLQGRMADYQGRTRRPTEMSDLLVLAALGFAGTMIAMTAGFWIEDALAKAGRFAAVNDIISALTWTLILVTAMGVILSLTRLRRLDGAGASQLGTALIYLLVTCIGVKADFRQVTEYPAYLVMAFVWLAVHIIVLIVVGVLIRAPVFLWAVGSQANIGGTASAPVVASAYHPALAPVGAVLAVMGYVLGTYAGLICMTMLKWVTGTG
jgi:uncharacterized membrane protein